MHVSVRPLLLHGDDQYQYRISGHDQQFLIPQLDEDDQEGPINSSKTAHPFITLKKCAITSTPVSQVSGLVERRR
jgi:hypothetical protein